MDTDNRVGKAWGRGRQLGEGGQWGEKRGTSAIISTIKMKEKNTESPVAVTVSVT